MPFYEATKWFGKIRRFSVKRLLADRDEVEARLSKKAEEFGGERSKALYSHYTYKIRKAK